MEMGFYLVASGPALEGAGPKWEQFQSAQFFPVNLHQGLYLYIFDKPRVDYTLARGPH